jgi:ABC-2 type transport system permease protein
VSTATSPGPAGPASTPVTPRRRVEGADLHGTWLLVRLALRRDRVLIVVWAILLSALCFVSALSIRLVYPDTETQLAAVDALNASPAVVALYGPILVPSSTGELAMTKLTVLYAVAVALLSVVVVRRHTRSDEESGRSELVAATAVPAWANLAAAVATAAAVSVLVGLLAAVADVAGGLPVAGSLLFGAAWAGVGLVGVGVGALACQLSASARTCLGIAAGGVLVLYVVRALGDTLVPGLSWLSPLGWSTRLLAWSDSPRWWLLLADVAVAAALVLAAVVLHGRRDLGSGLLQARPGPARGSRRLRGPVTLSWRSHRAGLVGWSVGALVLSMLMGGIVPSIGDLLDTPAAQAALAQLGGEGALEEVLVAALLSVVALVVAGYALSVVVSAAAEEEQGRTELVLAAPVGRARVAFSTALVAVVGATWLLLVSGVGLASTLAATGTSIGERPFTVVGAALAQAPAVWVTAAVGLLLVAVAPRAAAAGWAVLALFVLATELGGLPRVPGFVAGLSPFHHQPPMPAQPFDPTAAAALVAVTASLLVAAWWGYRRRDIGA